MKLKYFPFAAFAAILFIAVNLSAAETGLRTMMAMVDAAEDAVVAEREMRIARMSAVDSALAKFKQFKQKDEAAFSGLHSALWLYEDITQEQFRAFSWWKKIVKETVDLASLLEKRGRLSPQEKAAFWTWLRDQKSKATFLAGPKPSRGVLNARDLIARRARAARQSKI